MSFVRPSNPISALLIEPNGTLAQKLQDMLFGHFNTALDLGTARSLQECLSYLCAHRVALTLMNMTLPDSAGLDAVRTVRKTAPASALIALCTATNESLLLEAIGAGTHETLCLAELSTADLRLSIERAMVRAAQPGMNAGSTSPGVQGILSSSLPKLAHDLNNAITSINGFADILLARLPVETPDRPSVEEIRKAGARAAALVKALTPSLRSSSPLGTQNSVVTNRAA